MDIQNNPNFPARMSQVLTVFEEGEYNVAFDLLEQLLARFPDKHIEVLETMFFLLEQLPVKDRYSMYQSRYFDFNIKKGDKVLDIGSGNIPFSKSTDIADLFINDDTQGRAGCAFKHLEGRLLHECSVESLPFEDKSFDFIYCSHVLEHVGDPARACRELMRVGKRGYIETPAPAKDTMFNFTRTSGHKWAVTLRDEVLCFRPYTQNEIDGLNSTLLLEMVCMPKNRRERALNGLINLKAKALNTMLLWSESFEFSIEGL